MAPSVFSASTAAGYAGFLSTFITRGMALPDASIALRRKRLAAAISRLAVSKSRSFARWNPALDTDISPHLSLYVRLVDQIAPIERLQIRTAGFVQLGRIYLHPTPKCNWRLPQRHARPSAPRRIHTTVGIGSTNARTNDQFSRVLPPFKWVVRTDRH